MKKLIIIVTVAMTTLAHGDSKVVFLPFKGFRPPSHLVPEIVCPPYNTLNPEEARNLVQNNPKSFLHISRPEVDLASNTLPYAQTAGILGKKNFEKFIANKWLVQDEHPCFYLYEQENNHHRILSIIGKIAVKHYEDGIIKKHEKTIPEKESALTVFTDLQQANTDPVVLIYKGTKHIQQVLSSSKNAQPEEEFTSPNGTTHRLWALNNPEVTQQISSFFSTISSLYIADGHHRSASADHLYQKNKTPNSYDETNPYNFYLAALIANTDINLLSYNRIVRSLNNLCVQEFINKIKTSFAMQPLQKRPHVKQYGPHCIGMYLDQQWYLLTPNKQTKQKHALTKASKLSITLLNKEIIEPILNIMSLNDYDNIECVGGYLGLDHLEKKCSAKNWRLGFAVAPVSIENFIDLIENKELMPAKTTWFEPKFWQGIIAKRLED